MKLVDISGLGHSGKTVVNHLLSEVDGFYVHSPSFEFDLIRLPDGILDLKRNIVNNWTPIRSDIQIKRFLNLCSNLDNNYQENLSVNLNELAYNFVNNLTEFKLEIHWYDHLYSSDKDSFKYYLFKELKKIKFLKFLKRIIGIKLNNKKDTVRLIGSEYFERYVKLFLEEVLQRDKNFIVTNNAFEPFSPDESISFFENAYCIVVDRDPRDIYLSSLMADKIYIPSYEKENNKVDYDFIRDQKIDFLGSRNVDSFIWRQLKIRQEIAKNSNSNRVLRVRYEDLVLDYEKSVKKYSNFCV